MGQLGGFVRLHAETPGVGTPLSAVDGMKQTKALRHSILYGVPVTGLSWKGGKLRGCSLQESTAQPGCRFPEAAALTRSGNPGGPSQGQGGLAVP